MKNKGNGSTKSKKLVNIISKLSEGQSSLSHINNEVLLESNKENEVEDVETKEVLASQSRRKSKRKPEKIAKVIPIDTIDDETIQVDAKPFEITSTDGDVEESRVTEFPNESLTIVQVLQSDDELNEMVKEEENKENENEEKDTKRKSQKNKKLSQKPDIKCVRCTACGRNINVKKGKFCRHPDLNALICKQCFRFYSSGKFTKDEYGVEEFCRWCADGGQLICCDFCEKAFCKKCIKRNLGKSKLQELLNAGEDEKWSCFCCDPSPLSKIVKLCNRVMQTLEEEKDNKISEVLSSPTINERRNILSSPSNEQHNQNCSTTTSTSFKRTYEIRSNKSRDTANTCVKQEVLKDNDKEEDMITKNRSSRAAPVVLVQSSDEDLHESDKHPVDKKTKSKKKTASSSVNSVKKSREEGETSGSRNMAFQRNTKHDKSNSDASSSSDGEIFVLQKKKQRNKKEMSSKSNRRRIESDSADDFVQGKKGKTDKHKKLCESSDDDDSDEIEEDDDSETDDNSSESESESNTVVRRQRKKGKDRRVKEENSENSDSNPPKKSDIKKKGIKKVRKTGKWNLRGIRDETSDSDSDSANDNEGNFKSKKTRKTSKKDKTHKRKRKRRISEDEDSDEEEDASPSKKGRKKIRKILEGEKLTEATRHARQLEEERRQRLLERTANTTFDKPECYNIKELVLEYKSDGKTPLIEVDEDLVKHLKPHQVEGVKFMYDCTIESIERWKKNEEGGGCILAHVMGLGKTLQVVSLVYTLYKTEHIQLRRVLVVCPLNAVLNWETEFEKWINVDDWLDVYVLNEAGSDGWRRADVLDSWMKHGGILITGYTMYRNLSQCVRIRNKRQKKIFRECLVDPGPELVICDEGHVLRNSKSGISIALNNIKTRRRIVLTGTPLQNNLLEYHCMVSFVKPNLLGTLREFSNSFIRPIENGQCADSTAFDVMLMKKRCHVLHKMLEGCVQRKDYAEIARYLPPKFEYVVKIRLTAKQREIYKYYLDTFLDDDKGKGGTLFSDYQALMRIWTHPWSLKLDSDRKLNLNMIDSDEDSMKDFINDGEETSSDEMSWTSDDTSDSEKSEEQNSEESPENSDEEGTNKNDKRKSKKGENATRIKVDPDGPSTSKACITDISDGVDVKTNADTTKCNEGDVGKYNSKLRSGQEYTSEVIEEEKEWYDQFLTEEDEHNVQLGSKIVLLLEILADATALEEKVLVFSHSLVSLDVIEMALGGGEAGGNNEEWCRGCDYFRMDGSTSPQLRKRWADIFNDEDNKSARLFLISTKAGGIGINLVGATRVVVFDISWNPSHDVQSIFRAYRFGQKKPVFVYRLIAEGTMEEKIYDRQVMKQSMSQRVVDEKQIERHFNANDLAELYRFEPDVLENEDEKRPTPVVPKDAVLAELINRLYPKWIVKYHEHDSLLQNRPEEELSEAERKEAWDQWELEKNRILNGPGLADPTKQVINGTQFLQMSANVTFPSAQHSGDFQQTVLDQRRRLFEIERQKIVDSQRRVREQMVRLQVQQQQEQLKQQQQQNIQAEQNRLRLQQEQLKLREQVLNKASEQHEQQRLHQEQARLRQQQEQIRLRQQQEQLRIRQQHEQQRLRQQQEQQRLRQQQQQQQRLRQQQEQQKLRQQQQQQKLREQQQRILQEQQRRQQQAQSQQYLQQLMRDRNVFVTRQERGPNTNQTVFQVVMDNSANSSTSQQTAQTNRSPARIIELPPDA